MNYSAVRAWASNGDVIGVKGTNFIGKAIRFFTQEKYSHVALFVWHEGGLWVYEFLGRGGYQCTPASQWFQLRKGQDIWVGKAPAVVRTVPERVMLSASSFRSSFIKQQYGFLSYITIALAQITKSRPDTALKVCSTFVQHVWEQCGYRFTVTPDPGDVMRIAKNIAPLVKVQ